MENNVFIQNLLHKHDQSLIQSEELGRPIKKTNIELQTNKNTNLIHQIKFYTYRVKIMCKGGEGGDGWRSLIRWCHTIPLIGQRKSRKETINGSNANEKGENIEGTVSDR